MGEYRATFRQSLARAGWVGIIAGFSIGFVYATGRWVIGGIGEVVGNARDFGIADVLGDAGPVAAVVGLVAFGGSLVLSRLGSGRGADGDDVVAALGGDHSWSPGDVRVWGADNEASVIE